MVKSERHCCKRAARAHLRNALIGSTALLALPAQAQDIVPRNNYGSAGLIDMPSARMAPDGELSAGVFFTKNTQRYNLGFQVLPWLEVGFRYTGLNHFDPSYSVYFDRSFGLKARLWDESDWLPALAVGVNDIVGTGAYSGEFVVASKRIGAVDLSAGMGWGRMGSVGQFRNPLSLISKSFDTRPSAFGVTADPGAANFSNLFHGRDVGIFGGIAWETPIKGLTLLGEYSSDAYINEAATAAFIPQRQINLGAQYQISDNVQASISWMYGHSIAGGLIFFANPTQDSFPERIGPAMPAVHARNEQEQRTGLQALLDARDGRTRSTAAQRFTFASNAQLVDTLWRDPVSDVTITGQSAALRMETGDAETACRSAAQQVARFGAAIVEVTIQTPRASATCPVVSTGGLPFAPPLTFAASNGLNMTRTTEPLVIDAAGPRRADSRDAAKKIRAAASAQMVPLSALALQNGVATVYYGNNRYFSEADALERLTRVLMADAPPEIEMFRMIATRDGIPLREYSVPRASLERNLDQIGAPDIAETLHAAPAPGKNPVLMAAIPSTYPRFNWTVFPQFRQALFDPSNPFGVQFLAAAAASVEILPGLSASTQVEASLFDTFSVDRPSDSVLPHVRTDFLQYFTQGKNGIANLEVDYRFRLSPELFGIVRAGYLEEMFAGVGGEILYRPEGARWAMGGDLFAVKQRNFDRLFGLQSYEMITGHLSFYYQSPWYGLNMNVRIGRYLAGDYGATFEVTRRFSTGVEIGAFFSKTNVTAAQFGEGSFDKGIIIRIPLSWATPLQSQSQLAMDLRPVQRDGGQRLNGDAILYERTRALYEGNLAATQQW